MHPGRFVLTALLVLFLAARAWSLEPGLLFAGLPTTSTQIASIDRSESPPPSNSNNLTLADALRLTLQHNPELATFADEVRARVATEVQAGLLPNPELAIEVENFAGKDEMRGFDSAETTIALSQLVELGGKRGKRFQIARLDKRLSDWDYEQKKRDVLTAATQAFIEVLIAQEMVSQSDELFRLAEQTMAAVRMRVDAGKVPPMEEARARIELYSARTVAGKTRHELEAARRQLSSFWGENSSGFQWLEGDLTQISPPPSKEALAELVHTSPDLNRWHTELEQGQVVLSLAQAQKIPDVTVSLGIRNFQESNSNALVAAIELPLPLFNRNQGGIKEAQTNLSKIRHQRQAAETGLRAQVAQAWQKLSAAHLEVGTLREEILPAAESVYEAAEFGYREGKYDLLQMLDAQRTYFEVKGQYLKALAIFHLARTEMERYLGGPLHGHWALSAAINDNAQREVKK